MQTVVNQIFKSARAILNIRDIILLSVFSLFFAAALTVGQKIVYSGGIFGSYLQNYVQDFIWDDLLTWLVYFLISFVLMFILNLTLKLLDKVMIRSLEVEITKRTQYRYWIIATFTFFMCWLPYLLSSLPGALFADAYTSIYQALGIVGFNNAHPIMYSMIVKVLLEIGMLFGDINAGITFYTIVQMLIMAGALGYSLSWLYKHRVAKVYIWFAGIAFALFPLYPFYAVAMWKDTLFSVTLFLYSLCLLDVVLSRGKSVKSFWGAFHYVALAGFVITLRNNGLYIVIICTVIFAIKYRKQLFNQLKLFLIGNLILLTISVIILFPIMSYLKIESPFAETVGIPLQQVSRVVVLDGDMTDEQADFIDQLIPHERIKESYTPCIVDRIKWNPEFNDEFLEANKGEFLSTWGKMFWSNKKIYIDAHLLETAGFWAPTFGGIDRPAYVQIGVWPLPFKKELGIREVDLIKEGFGFSFIDIVRPKKPIPEATFIWLLFASLTLTLCRNRNNCIVYLPSLFVLIALWIGTPLAMSLRYIYVFVLMLPFLLVFPLLSYGRDSVL